VWKIWHTFRATAFWIIQVYSHSGLKLKEANNHIKSRHIGCVVQSLQVLRVLSVKMIGTKNEEEKERQI
jgi:hypothetical protein